MSQRTVLMVDDERILARNIAELFRQAGWVSQAVFSGRACVEKVRESSFDAIVLDMRMPEMDGFETLRKILSIRPDACVVFLTAYGDVDSAVHALHEGAVNLVLKPIAFETLLVLVEDAIQRKQDEIDALEKERAEAVLILALGMAHQIRNGLNAVGYRIKLAETDTAQDELAGHLQDARHILQMTDLSVRRLYRYSQAQRIQRVPVDLSTAVLKAIEMAKLRRDDSARAELASISVEVPASVEVMADAEFLVEAIECLVDNAIDAAPRDGRILITSSNRAGMVELEVRDNGPGFAPELLRVAHEPFRTSRKRTHIGFGLTFAQQVAKACGGELRYGNAEDAPGAIVTLSLVEAPGKQ